MDKAGWKTSEGLMAFLQQLAAWAVAAGLITSTDYNSVTQAFAKGGVALAALVVAGWVLRAYIASRTEVKTTQALNSAGQTILAASQITREVRG